MGENGGGGGGVKGMKRFSVNFNVHTAIQIFILKQF
jgi:hypothetical protein